MYHSGYFRRFAGTARLVGDEIFKAYAHAHVLVIGIGGVGSWSAEALARSGVGKLTLIDLDMISESNINRQIHALDDVIGAAKVDVMASRIKKINPQCIIKSIEDFITSENLANILSECPDVVIDATDQVRVKAELAAYCVHKKIALIVVGAAGGKTDPTRIKYADLARTIQDPLLAKVRSQLRRNYGFGRGEKVKFGIQTIYSDEPVSLPISTSCDAVSSGLSCSGYGSSVCVTATFGLVAAQQALKLIERRVSKSQ